MTLWAYARTSTQDQLAGLAAQERDLLAAGAERMVSEHISSVADRPRFRECLASLQRGDVLMATKPDRLARSTAHLLAMIEDLDRRGVGLIVLSMGGARLDTRNPTSKLMLTMLAAFAEFERTLMIERQREGIAKARSAGKYRGRKPSIDKAELRRVAATHGPAEAIRRLGIGQSRAYEILREGRA